VMSMSQKTAKLQSEYQCPSKVTPIHWKDWGGHAKTNCKN
jgi:hypothetical protein